MGPGIFAPQGECTKLKKVTATGTFCLSREQIQRGQVLTHYFGTHKATKKQKGMDFKQVIAAVKIPRAPSSQLQFCIIFSKAVRRKISCLLHMEMREDLAKGHM